MLQLARIRRSAFWGRLRRALRPLGEPRAFVGWMLLLLDMAHRIEFVTSLFRGTEALVFFEQWGWLVGILWLAAVVVWAANKPRDEEVQKARSMERLRSTMQDVIRKFEALAGAYEKEFTERDREACFRRLDLALAVGRLLKDAVETIPENQRWEYKGVFMQVLLDYRQYYDRDVAPTMFASEVHPTLAIQYALDLNQPKESNQGKPPDSAIQPPSTDPPSSKASA